MLELAVKKLGEYNPVEDNMTTRAKKLLQKSAHAMISRQELSGQQVASYLLDLEDDFTSHSYRNFHWTSFESFVNREDPSPECCPSKASVNTPETTRNNATADPDDDDDSESQSDSEHETEPRFLNDVLGEQDPEEAADIGDADEEIRVSFDGTGKLVCMGNQLADYQKRGTELDRVCAWDFIFRVDRISKSSDRRRLRPTAENEDNLRKGII
jgi:hypothetical protein